MATPPVANKTRWSGEYNELVHFDENYNRICQYVEKANDRLDARLVPLTDAEREVIQLAIKVLKPIEVFTTKLEGKDAGAMAANWFVDLWIQLQSFVLEVYQDRKSFNTHLSGAWRSLGLDREDFSQHRPVPMVARPYSPQSDKGQEDEDADDDDDGDLDLELKACQQDDDENLGGDGPKDGEEPGSEDEEEDSEEEDGDPADEGDRESESDAETDAASESDGDDDNAEVDLDKDLAAVVDRVAKDALEAVVVAWNRYASKINPGLFAAHVSDPRFVPLDCIARLEALLSNHQPLYTHLHT